MFPSCPSRYPVQNDLNHSRRNPNRICARSSLPSAGRHRSSAVPALQTKGFTKWRKTLLRTTDGEKLELVLDEIKNGTRRMHPATGRAGVDQPSSIFPLIVPDMGMPGKKIVVPIRRCRPYKGRLVITVNKRNFFTRQLKLPKTPQNLHTDVLRIEIPPLRDIAVSQYHIERDFQGLEKIGHFGEHHIVPNIATMKHSLSASKNEFTSRAKGHIHLAVCI